MTVTIFFRGNPPWFLNSLRPNCELSDRKLMLGIRWFTSTGEHDGPMWNLHGVYTMNRDEPYSCAEFWMILYMVTWLNEAIWCYMMLYDVISGYIMMFYDVIWYYTMLYDVIWCYIRLYNDVLWCYMILYDVIWCYMMLHDVIWCFVLFERTLILWNCWWKLIISWSMCENPTGVIWFAKYGLLKWSRW